MSRKHIKTWVVAGSVVLGLGYMATSPALKLGDLGSLIKAVKPVSKKNEIKIGRGIAAKLMGAAPPVNDPQLQSYVNKIGKWLALQTKKPKLPWRFAVLDIDDVNAFAVPGGYVLLTRGLLLIMRDESELAGVLAHEIIHVVERHALKTMRKGEFVNLGGVALSAIAENKGQSEDFNKIVNVGTEVFNRGLDKKDEFAADYQGVVVAARGGYDPYGLVAILQTLASINPEDGAVARMFKTHPDPEVRMERLMEFLDDKLEKYANQPNNAERFAQVMRIHVANYTPTERTTAGGDEGTAEGDDTEVLEAIMQ